VYVSAKRDVKAATRSFSKSIRVHGAPAEVTTDRSGAGAQHSRAAAGACTTRIDSLGIFA